MSTLRRDVKPVVEVDGFASEPTLAAEQKELTIRKILDAKWPPLIPVKPKQPSEAFKDLLTLTYHRDVVTEPSPLIVLGSPSKVNGNDINSRRVVVFNLPPDASAPQVVLGICHGEGLLGVRIVKHGPMTRDAELLFEKASDAKELVRHMEFKPVSFQAEDESLYEAKVWLVPTPSWTCAQEQAWLDQGCTRSLSLGYLPIGLVWQAISAVDVRQICRIHYEGKKGCLTLEMTSIGESVKAKANIQVVLGYEPWYTQISAGCIHDNATKKGAVVKHLACGQPAKEWNCWPWNMEKEASRINWAAEWEAYVARKDKALAESLDISVEELPDYLESREKFNNIDYYIIGSRIKLTRKAWSWSITVEDDHKLLMANTLHDPEWAQEWDETFEAEGTPNLRTWERYGMLAHHRREKAREQGLEDWQVPDCKGSCEWGCCPLEACPVPLVVRRFLEDGPEPGDYEFRTDKKPYHHLISSSPNSVAL
ncbi:hypothetical protein L249_8609 [Ophiocordyceps polyrhachis-furcata BCC 54312]|uniref:Uncharacterized protein n=1 Tax=Ophiocordyceps polyrhachis-furcata BCC 54312 TaxID=1330021 RepID=A0A367L6R8_9HYPO|nr:hypothetical protein L249_8609 [Ophiocordyceps polyrhachis-furcata BCC 54312]